MRCWRERDAPATAETPALQNSAARLQEIWKPFTLMSRTPALPGESLRLGLGRAHALAPNKKARLGERAWGKEENLKRVRHLFFFFAFFAAITSSPPHLEVFGSVYTATLCGRELYYGHM